MEESPPPIRTVIVERELGQNDVLVGRGTGPNVNKGNVRFRALVSERKEEYLAYNPRDHRNKNRIASEILDVVAARGGRFMKRCSSGEYELVGRETAMEKARQALRQKRDNKPAAKPKRASDNDDGKPTSPSDNSTTAASADANGNVKSSTITDPQWRRSKIQERATHATSRPNRDECYQEFEAHQPDATPGPYQAFKEHLRRANIPMSPSAATTIAGADQSSQISTLRSASIGVRPQSNSAESYEEVAGPQLARHAGLQRQSNTADSFEKAVAHLRQANNSMSAAEAAIRHLQMQNHTATVKDSHALRGVGRGHYGNQINMQNHMNQQQCRPRHSLHENSTLGKNIYVAKGGGGANSGWCRNPISMQQSYFPRQHSIGSNSMPATSARNPGSDYVRFHLEQQLKHNFHLSEVPVHAGMPYQRGPLPDSVMSSELNLANGTADAANIRFRLKQQMKQNLKNEIRRNSLLMTGWGVKAESASLERGWGGQVGSAGKSKKKILCDRAAQKDPTLRTSGSIGARERPGVDSLSAMSSQSVRFPTLPDSSACGVSLPHPRRSVGLSVTYADRSDSSSTDSSTEATKRHAVSKKHRMGNASRPGDKSASTPKGSEHIAKHAADPTTNGSYISDSQMRGLERMFANTTRRAPLARAKPKGQNTGILPK